MGKVEIVIASKSYEQEYCDYVSECYRNGIDHYAEAVNDPKSYLQRVIANSTGNLLPVGWVPMTTYFAVENGRILGVLRLRKGTNNYISNVIGNIGYETRPSERKRGVARTLLQWLKEHHLKVDAIMTCSADNIASRKVIESCGGEFIDSYYCHETQRLTLKFKLSPGQS